MTMFVKLPQIPLGGYLSFFSFQDYSQGPRDYNSSQLFDLDVAELFTEFSFEVNGAAVWNRSLLYLHAE